MPTRGILAEVEERVTLGVVDMVLMERMGLVRRKVVGMRRVRVGRVDMGNCDGIGSAAFPALTGPSDSSGIL